MRLSTRLRNRVLQKQPGSYFDPFTQVNLILQSKLIIG